MAGTAGRLSWPGSWPGRTRRWARRVSALSTGTASFRAEGASSSFCDDAGASRAPGSTHLNGPRVLFSALVSGLGQGSPAGPTPAVSVTLGHPGTLPGLSVLICPVGAVQSAVGVTWTGRGGGAGSPDSQRSGWSGEALEEGLALGEKGTWGQARGLKKTRAPARPGPGSTCSLTKGSAAGNTGSSPTSGPCSHCVLH